MFRTLCLQPDCILIIIMMMVITYIVLYPVKSYEHTLLYIVNKSNSQTVTFNEKEKYSVYIRQC